MLNRRTISRYHLARPLTGYIEHGSVRYPGEITELSTAGFRLRLRDISKEAFVSPTVTDDFGEMVYRQDELGGFGDVRYVRPEGSDLLIGFKWDSFHIDENIQQSFAIIAELVSQGIAGCVSIGHGCVNLVGHVSSALADDLQERIAQGLSRVSLRECSSIDESGLALLIGQEQDSNIRLMEASPEISSLLDHYRQERTLAHSGSSLMIP